MRFATRALVIAVVFLPVPDPTHAQVSPPIPTVSGPVTGPGPMYPNQTVGPDGHPVTSPDFPFSDEYFVSGTANGEPYVTRMAIRRPAAGIPFSGIVVAEAMHAGGRSLVFEWSRHSIVTRNHLAVEIPHSAGNITLLRAFNDARYKTLSVSAGQANEIIAQIGRLIKSRSGPFASYDVRHVTLMGTSASSGTVRAYFDAHKTVRMPGGGPIFDGFLLTSTNGNTPLPVVDVPVIQMPTQTEVATWAEAGIKYRRPDSDEPGNRFRLYEVAGMPHNYLRDRRQPRPTTELGGTAVEDPCTLQVSDFPAGAFTALALNHLIEWIANGRTPPRAPVIAVDQDASNDGSFLALDQFGNAKGGIRNVWVDVPIATYGVFGVGRSPESDRLCRLAGTKVPLPESTLRTLYRNREDYLARANRRLDELIREGWFLPEYAEMVRENVFRAIVP